MQRIELGLGSAGRLIDRGQGSERDPSRRPGELRAEDRIDDLAGVHRVEHRGVALPLPARLKSPAPSMKNGRFSEKKIGNRWLTSTWNASLSTWLKSGLTVASSVTVDERPHFTLRPRSPSLSAWPHSDGVARSWSRENVADGMISRVGRGAMSANADLRVLLEHPLARLEEI